MKRKFLLIGLLAFACGAAPAIAQWSDDFVFYYLNGIDNDLKDALGSRFFLRQKALPDVPNKDVDILYQQNEAALTELIQVYRQSLGENYRNFWMWLADLSAAPDSFRTNVYRRLSRYDENTYIQDSDLQDMITKLKLRAQSSKKAILIGHSQGNFYANRVASYLQSFEPKLAACVGVVGVASLATHVANSGPYTTLTNDSAVNTGRAFLPWGAGILPPSPVTPVFNITDISGHQFVESYLFPLHDRIRSQIMETAAKVEGTCLAGCGTPISGAGSTGTYAFYQTIGEGRRTVTAHFEAYSIPDQLEIFANGRRLAGTNGLVSGFHTLNFEFDSTQLGTTQLEARVTGNSNVDTQWKLCLDCEQSGNSFCGSDGSPVKRKLVTIGYSYSNLNFVCEGGNVNVDGTHLGRIGGSGSVSTMLTIGGPHVLQATGGGCACRTLVCPIGARSDARFTVTYPGGGQVFPQARQIEFNVN